VIKESSINSPNIYLKRHRDVTNTTVRRGDAPGNLLRHARRLKKFTFDIFQGQLPETLSQSGVDKLSVALQVMWRGKHVCLKHFEENRRLLIKRDFCQSPRDQILP
jgi:hypothetical protein